MTPDPTAPDPAPDRSDAAPETYAIRVTDRRIHVWQYRVTVAAPDGDWAHVETLDRADGPRLSLAYARPSSPDPDGYWLYSRSYDCELDCE